MLAIGKKINTTDYLTFRVNALIQYLGDSINKGIYNIIYNYPSLLKYNRLTNPSIKQNILCAGIFIRKDQLQKLDTSNYVINTHLIGKDKNLLSTDFMYMERYIKKAAGSCFFKNEDTISSAYHIVDATGGDIQMFIENYCAVFGFINSSTETVFIPKEHVIELDSVIASATDENIDFIDFKIKGKIPSFIKIPSSFKGKLKSGMEIYVAGYPLKSSLTITVNATIQEVGEGYFTTYADLFEYSSGSPVFLMETNELIGFVKGSNERDFIQGQNSNFMQTNIIQSSESKGKKIILIKN